MWEWGGSVAHGFLIVGAVAGIQGTVSAIVKAVEDMAKEAMHEKRLTRSGANEILAEYREAIEGYTYLDVNE